MRSSETGAPSAHSYALRNNPLWDDTVDIREAVVTPANSTNSVRAANKTPGLQQRISETQRN